ncbi:MAG: phosphoribosylglycinamide formyltransferase [Bacillota bacterium]|nr:phosphoribosylglycinamide formyltransferase [Bacillota bacterium]
MLKISVMVSGGGTNFQAVIDGVSSGLIPDAKIVQVISSSGNAFALERAKKHGIPGFVVSSKEYPDLSEKTDKILKLLNDKETDLIVLAGYMSVVDKRIVDAYRGRIINIHPSLIPKYCGKGFYGKRVHEAVIAGGEKVSGATVHFVDEGVDTGAIIIQEQVPVLPEDTADELAARVLVVEHKILTEAIRRIASGEMILQK